MTAAEKELLQYFKQETTPLFTNDEMKTIYNLVLQAAMKNEPGENCLLDNIIHKAECILPQVHELQVQLEPEAFPNEIVQ